MSLHLVTGSDDNYAAGVLVLIASAAFHTPDLRVTVLDNGISAANRARIDALGPRLGITLRRIEIDPDAFAALPPDLPASLSIFGEGPQRAALASPLAGDRWTADLGVILGRVLALALSASLNAPIEDRTRFGVFRM